MVKALVLASLLGIAPFLGPASATAQDAQLEVNADAIKVDVEGTVVAVGTAGVHVGRLVGMDFFDAVVRLDQVAAVIVRAR